MLLQLLGIAASILILYFFKQKSDNNGRNPPPGPVRFPVVGNLPQAIWASLKRGKKIPPYDAMRELNEKYGPIVSFQNGQMGTIVTDDYDTIKEILTSEVWVDRLFDKWFGQRSWDHPYGLLFSSGAEWKEMRRFTLRTLRDFGFGKHKSQEGVMSEELDHLATQLDSKIDSNSGVGTVPMKQFFTISVLNVLWSMITGSTFSHQDERLKRFNRMTSELIQRTTAGGNLANSFPILTPYLARETKPMFDEMNQYFRELLEEKRALGDYKHDQRDFVEVFLKEIDNQRGSSPNYYSDNQFVVVTLDLFMAGSETTSNSLEFAILYMILNPAVQARVQAEIDLVVGSSRNPAAGDRQSMPFTEATLLEVQRFANVLPFDSRSAKEDTKLGGYDIKKGTAAMINLHSMHFSAKIWTHPATFDPTRFLDATGLNIVNAHKIMPFGAGKRACVGESMARLTLFTYFTTLLQRYSFSTATAPGLKPSYEPVQGFTMSPKEYEVKVERR